MTSAALYVLRTNGSNGNDPCVGNVVNIKLGFPSDCTIWNKVTNLIIVVIALMPHCVSYTGNT